ncbi:MAG: transcriptional regulator [Acidobacteria bacterium]|nr:MAG: transcriptional regulator [Acidobacteriota bacterium]
MNVLHEFLEFIEISKPQPIEELLRRVLLKSRQLTGAEAGSIFLVRGSGGARRLEASNAQNDVVPLEPAQIVVPISQSSIAGFTAITGETVFVDNLYEISAGLPYTFDPSFDLSLGYCSRSMLSFPLLNHDRRVIGVVQLINRRGRDGEGPLSFQAEQADLIVPFNHIVGSAIERADMTGRIEAQNVRLKKRNAQLKVQRERIAILKDQTEEAFQLSISLLARAAEVHDENTARHVERVNEYAYFLSGILGVSKAFCDEIRYSAQLHDVGKMSIDMAILRKKGPLTDDERDEMKRHPVYGYRILSASNRLRMAGEIALSHHERWDGNGYPHGRKGREIPLAARIVAVADIYDALRSKRPYKPGFDHERTRRILLEGDDRMDVEGLFDPQVIEAFIENHRGFDEIWNRLAG